MAMSFIVNQYRPKMIRYSPSYLRLLNCFSHVILEGAKTTFSLLAKRFFISFVVFCFESQDVQLLGLGNIPGDWVYYEGL